MSDRPLPDLLRELAAQLAAAGIDQAEYESKALLGHVLGQSLSEVERAIIMGQAFPADRLPALTALAERRAGREPLQHILGRAPFRYLELAVGPGVFVPRPETELLVDEALGFLAAGCAAAERATVGGKAADETAADGTASTAGSPAADRPVADSSTASSTAPVRPLQLVDLCAGSGAIGLALLTELAARQAALPPERRITYQVWAVEKSPAAFDWLRRNQAQLPTDLAAAYTSLLADACQPATLLELDGQVDCLVSNPPYVPQSQPPTQPEAAADPDLALFGGSPDGLAIPEQIIDRAARLLRPGGLLVMEHDQGQADRLVDYGRRQGFEQVTAHRDLTGRPRYITAVARGEKAA